MDMKGLSSVFFLLNVTLQLAFGGKQEKHLPSFESLEKSLVENLLSDLEREEYVEKYPDLYAMRKEDDFLWINLTSSRIQHQLDTDDDENVIQAEPYHFRKTRDAVGPGTGGGVRSGNRYSYGNGEKRPQSFRTGRQQVKYLPYSPSHGKWISDDSAPFADMDTIDRFAGEDLTGERLLSRHPRQTVKTRRLMTELVDPEEEEQEQVPIKPKRVAKKKMEKSVFAYDVDVAYGGGLKGYTNLSTSSDRMLGQVVEPTDDVLAFDLSLPLVDANPGKSSPEPWMNPVELQQAMESAMSMGHEKYMRTVANYRPAQCLVGADGDRATSPLIWTMGRPTNNTRFAYQSEFAGRRMADQLAGGDAGQLFSRMTEGLNGDDADCYVDSHFECNSDSPYRTFDGTCNNLADPQKGAANAPQNRLAPPNYDDGISSPRTTSSLSKIQGKRVSLPSARRVSTSFSQSAKIPNRRFTSLFNSFSQLLAHDIVNTPVEKVSDPNNPKKAITPKCCGTSQTCVHPACFPISVPADDPFYAEHGVSCLEFVRAQPAPRQHCQLGPRQPVNWNTAYIDSSEIYGSDAKTARRLRAKRKGLLRINDSPIVKEQGLVMCPGGKNRIGCVAPNPEMPCVDAGDDRVNQHTGLVAIHSLFLREHNRIAGFISKNRPELSDETVFQATRKIMAAVRQHITYNEMLPPIVGNSIYKNPKNGLLLKKNGFCECYDEQLDATINVEFAAAGFRFHTMLSDWLPAHDSRGKLFPFYQHFGNAKMFYKPGILDEILSGFPHDIPEKFDEQFSFIFQNQVFKPVDKPYGLDMFSFNIQRGRDLGVASYMQMRRSCNLPAIQSFKDLSQVMPPDAAKKLTSVYRTLDDIDLYAGGVSENAVNGNGLIGPTFACILTEQFKRLKNADRFWYENEGVFSTEQLKEIRKSSLAAILCINTPIEEIQHRPFLRESPANPREPCEDILQNDMRLEPFLNNIKIARKPSNHS